MESTQVPESAATTAPPDGTSEPHSTPSLHPWLWRPNLIAFVSSACIMILELVAGRIIAPFVGVSLYTWTSVIGVVLAGISVGNYLGGRLADRRASLRLLGTMFLLAGLCCFGVLLLGALASSELVELDPISRVTWDDWPIIVQILALTALLFFIPSCVLGTISPVVAKLAVRDFDRVGSTVGKIYAAGALGSIVGTFVTGFVLISWLGTYTIVWGVATVLVALGLLFTLSSRWRTLTVLILLLAGASTIVSAQGWLHGPCDRETNYFCIKVLDTEKDGEPVRALVLDRMVHSYTSPDNPTKLSYDYERMYAELTAYRALRDDHLRALFIGGGGYTFPRYMEAVYPGSDIHVIEIDPGVTEVAHESLGLDRAGSVVTYNEDARLFLERQDLDAVQGEPIVYDLIMGDAFNDFSVPYHLTTREFNDRVKAWLEDDGLYLINMIDGPQADFLRAYVHTLRQTFLHVYVAPDSESWRELARSTFILVACDEPLDREALSTVNAGGGEQLLLRRMFSEIETDRLMSAGRLVTLTDRYAPVDQLLAPVFREQGAR